MPQAHWVDYPGLGFDQSAIYVTGNTGYPFGSAGQPDTAGVLLRTFDKQPLLSGQSQAFPVPSRLPDPCAALSGFPAGYVSQSHQFHRPTIQRHHPHIPLRIFANLLPT